VRNLWISLTMFSACCNFYSSSGIFISFIGFYSFIIVIKVVSYASCVMSGLIEQIKNLSQSSLALATYLFRVNTTFFAFSKFSLKTLFWTSFSISSSYNLAFSSAASRSSSNFRNRSYSYLYFSSSSFLIRSYSSLSFFSYSAFSFNSFLVNFFGGGAFGGILYYLIIL
jgi:hypothetical protein